MRDSARARTESHGKFRRPAASPRAFHKIVYYKSTKQRREAQSRYANRVFIGAVQNNADPIVTNNIGLSVALLTRHHRFAKRCINYESPGEQKPPPQAL